MFNRLLNGPGLSLLDQGIVSLGNFLSVIIASKVMTGSEFGIYVISVTTIFIVTGLISALVSVPMRVHGVGLAEEELDVYVTENIIYLFALSIPSALGIVLILPLIIDISYSNSTYTGLAFLCFQFHDMSRVVRSIKFRWLTLILSDITMHSIRIIIFFILWKFDVLDIRNALLIYALSSLVSISLTRYLLNVQIVSLNSLMTTIFNAWRFGRWILGESLVFTLSTQIYVLLIGVFLNTTMAGIYGAIQQLVNVINVVHIGLMNYISLAMKKKLNNVDYKGWVKLGKAVALTLFLVTFVIVTVLGVYAKEIINILYVESMMLYSGVLYIFLIAALTASLNAVLTMAFRTSNQPQMGLKVKIFSAVITTIVSYPLIRYLGIYGAAIGVVITQLSWFVMYLYEIQVNKKLSVNHVALCLRAN